MHIRKVLISALKDVHNPYGSIIIDEKSVLVYNDISKTGIEERNSVWFTPDDSVRFYKAKLISSDTLAESIYYVFFIKHNRGYIYNILRGNANLMYLTSPASYDFADIKYTIRFEKEYDNFIFQVQCRDYGNATYAFDSFIIRTKSFSMHLSYSDAKKMFKFDKEAFTIIKAISAFYPNMTKNQSKALQKLLAKGSRELFVPMLSTHGYDFYSNVLDDLAAFKDNEFVSNKRTARLEKIAQFLKKSFPLHIILHFKGTKHYKHKHYGVVECGNGSIEYVYVKTKTGIMPLMYEYEENRCYKRILKKILDQHKKMKEVTEKLGFQTIGRAQNS